jgi:hypothetical protein
MSQGPIKRAEEAGPVGEKWHSASKVRRFVSTEPLSEVVRHNLLTRERLALTPCFYMQKFCKQGVESIITRGLKPK